MAQNDGRKIARFSTFTPASGFDLRRHSYLSPGGGSEPEQKNDKARKKNSCVRAIRRTVYPWVGPGPKGSTGLIALGGGGKGYEDIIYKYKTKTKTKLSPVCVDTC